MHIAYPINLIYFDGHVDLIEDEAAALSVNLDWNGIKLAKYHGEYYDQWYGAYIQSEDTVIARDNNGAIVTRENWPAAPYRPNRFLRRRSAEVNRAMELGLPIPHTSCWKKGSYNNKKRHVGDNRRQEGHSQQLREATGHGHVRRARAKVDWDRNYRHQERNWKSQRKTQWK